jgi:hypothetical protein
MKSTTLLRNIHYDCSKLFLKNEISAIMPPKRRAQAFSGKKKKEQLQQKRKLSKSTVPSHAGQLKLS